MTIFIIWKHSDDALFRQEYFKTVAEYIQDYPRNNGEEYMIGSSRISGDQISTLSELFPTAVFCEDIPDTFKGETT